MGKIREVLKQTPLRPIWWKVKDIPPLKQIFKLESNIYKHRTMDLKYPELYRQCAQAPMQENKVIFLEIRLPSISNSFQELYKAVKAAGKYEIHEHYLRNGFVYRKEYVSNCLKFIEDAATAKYIFINEASDMLSCLPLREGTIVTQTWHGCGAFKKFGMSTADLIFGGTRKDKEKHPYYKNMTYLTLSSPEVAWAYEEAMQLSDRKEVIKPIGVSRTDVFFQPDFIRQAREKLYQVMPESKGKKVILYAPTFRGRVGFGKAPDQLDFVKFQKAFGDEYVLLAKHHPFVRELPVIPKECKGFAKDVTKSMAIDDLICVADICISDYSSLVFEYSLFERPMIFFAYDKDEYDDWRGFYYNYEEMTPGPICKTNEEMIDYIRSLKDGFDPTEVIAFREKFMGACDGHATDRIMKMVFGEDR